MSAEETQDIPLITFGSAPGNRLTLPQVEIILRLWHGSEPEHMGNYIAEAVTGARPRTRRARQ